MTMPKDIRHNLAKAKGYLQKHDVPLALESVSMTLRDVNSHHLKSVSAVEREVNAILQQLMELPLMRPLLDPHDKGTPYVLHYQYGKEGALTTVLREFAKILRDQQQKMQEKQLTHDRLQDLLQKGFDFIEEGKLGTGASFLQLAAKEYPQDAERVITIAQTLRHYGLHEAAGKTFLSCLKHHPKNKDFYSKGIEAFVAAENYAGAELIFRKAFQQFGRHPRSLAKLAELYVLWDKEDEAEAMAHEALALNADEEVAQQVLMAIDTQLAIEMQKSTAIQENTTTQEIPAPQEAPVIQEMAVSQETPAIQEMTDTQHGVDEKASSTL